MNKKFGVHPDVLKLGLVSFLTDVSSEMIFSVFAIFFTTIAGLSYRVDYTNQISAGWWFALTNHIPGTGGPVRVSDPGAAARRSPRRPAY